MSITHVLDADIGEKVVGGNSEQTEWRRPKRLWDELQVIPMICDVRTTSAISVRVGGFVLVLLLLRLGHDPRRAARSHLHHARHR